MHKFGENGRDFVMESTKRCPSWRSCSCIMERKCGVEYSRFFIVLRSYNDCGDLKVRGKQARIARTKKTMRVAYLEEVPRG